MICDCHEVPAEPGDALWLKEDGTILCEDGRWDELREDPMDRFDHGSELPAGLVLDTRAARQ
jgi:hypothetical protein